MLTSSGLVLFHDSGKLVHFGKLVHYMQEMGQYYESLITCCFNQMLCDRQTPSTSDRKRLLHKIERQVTVTFW